MSLNSIVNPAPLGLFGFGMATILLNFHNAGFFPLSSVIISMGIIYGGLGQFIAGLISYKNGSTFNATAFTAFGSFWLALIGLILLPKTGLVEATDSAFLGIFFTIWSIFTFLMFIGTFKENFALQFVFFSLGLLLALLAIGSFSGNAKITEIAGYEGIICGASACYLAIALVFNDQYGKTIFPIGRY